MSFSLLVLRVGLWDVIVLIPDHCLSIFFDRFLKVQSCLHLNIGLYCFILHFVSCSESKYLFKPKNENFSKYRN